MFARTDYLYCQVTSFNTWTFTFFDIIKYAQLYNFNNPFEAEQFER